MASLPASETAIYWMDQPPRFEIVDGIARCLLSSGGYSFEFRCTKNTILKGVRNATNAVQREADGAAVLPFKGKRKH